MSILYRKYLKKNKKIKKRYLFKCPQKKGLCLIFFTRTPRKPNSARRKCVWVRLSNGKRIGSYIPGIGYNIQKFSSVLVRGKGPKDLPGIHFRLVRHAYDLLFVANRFSSRSKYGCRRIRYTRQSEEFLRLKLISRRTITVKFDPIDKAFKDLKKKKLNEK